MRKFSIFTIVMIVVLAGCSRQGFDLVPTKEVSYDISKMPDTLIQANGDTLKLLIDVEEILMDDTDIICISDLDTFAFHRLDADKFVEKEKFGRRGQGPDEFTNPQLLPLRDGRLYLIDSWRYRMHSMDLRDTISYGNRLFNQPKEIEFPLIGYYSLDHGSRELFLYDVKYNVVTDSIDFQNINEKLKTTPLFWDTNGEKIVVAFFGSDMIVIFDIVDGRIKNPILCNGEGKDGVPAFIGVVCLDDCFALLTNREISDDSSFSKIVIFDYEGNPLEKINTGVQARRMTYDEKNGCFILSGRATEALYKVDYSRK